MIISRTLEYVYIGIPRTGSKSMNRWLMENHQGEWYGDHHDWQVPAFAKEYLTFTTVRNPYQRAVSGYFGIPWDEHEKKEELREQVPLPDKSKNPLTKIIQEAIALSKRTSGAEGNMSQREFVEKAGVSFVLFYERLPDSLGTLPFVDEEAVSSFPHVMERGIRPPGNFFDFFSERDEESLWDYDAGDFEMFGYRRFYCGLPEDSPDALRVAGCRKDQRGQ